MKALEKTEGHKAELSKLWRSRVTPRCGGEEFDTPTTGYSFTAVLDEEEYLRKGNIPGDPSSALLTLSVADPTWKMEGEAIAALVDYYRENPDATRYTDNAGIRFIGPEPAKEIYDTQRKLAEICDIGRDGRKQASLSDDWIQYLPGSIKRALSEYLPTLLFDKNTLLLFPTPSYQVITDPKNNRGALIEEIPMFI